AAGLRRFDHQRRPLHLGVPALQRFAGALLAVCRPADRHVRRRAIHPLHRQGSDPRRGAGEGARRERARRPRTAGRVPLRTLSEPTPRVARRTSRVALNVALRQGTVSMELVGLLILAGIVVGPIWNARRIQQPLDVAAKMRRRPIRIYVIDFIALTTLLALA